MARPAARPCAGNPFRHRARRPPDHAFGHRAMEDVMAISQRLRGYMDRCGTRFDEWPHEHSSEMARAAQAAHVPGRQVAKAVLVQAGDEYMLAVLPSSKHVSRSEERRVGKECVSPCRCRV